MKNCLVLLTKNYPFDKGEEFIENEVPVLAKSFERVILIATSVGDSPVQTRKTPDNVSVYYISASKIKHSLPLTAAKFFPFANFRGYCDADEKKAIRHSLKRRLFLTYFLAKSESVYRGAKAILEGCQLGQYGSITFYSYWFYDTAIAALKLKEWCQTGKKCAVSRAHGYDLYPHRNSLNYLPLRNYILSHIDKLYPCSDDGSNYLKKEYPAFQDKIQTAYLGTNDFGICDCSSGDVFQIVSCCHIVPIKRVELLAQALACLKGSGLKLKWTHFGGGEGLADLQQFAGESLGFMEYHFAGEVKNTELMYYYRSNPVNLFVNTSSSEGLPVSIMEACSFGIPIIATDVGGTGEIVVDGKTGFLVKPVITPEELAEKIKFAAKLPENKMQTLRENCRSLWLQNFWAEKNFEKFAQDIKVK